MFAALNSVEPQVQNLTTIDLFFANEEWAKLRRAGAENMAQLRLDELATSLEGRDYLEGKFSAGDLLMVTVLRLLRHTSLVTDMPVLAAYQARCEARPAFKRALAAQLTHFEKNTPIAA
jgi:glutathione S-transferase